MAYNSEYRLQLRSHKTLFQTRDEAIDYLNSSEISFASNGLTGEPVVLFYGEPENPKMILAVNSKLGQNTYAYIDDAELRELINEAKQGSESGNVASKLIDRVIEKTGLTKTDLFEVVDGVQIPYIDYKPDSENRFIKNCQTMAEAINVLANAITDGSIISDFDTNNQRFDDNIIVNIPGHGLLSSVNLSYDENTNTLRFTRSGIVDGQPKTEAYSIDFALSTPKIVDHASYNASTNELVIIFDNGESVTIPVGGLIDEFRANNDGHTVTVNVNTDGEDGFTEFSADVNLSSTDNLISKNNGELKVSESVVTQIATGKVGEAEARINTSLSLKADKTDLQSKADKTELNGLLSGVSYSDTRLTFERKNAASTIINLSDLIDEYTLPAATSNRLGGVIIEEGSGLSINEEGRLSVVPSEAYNLPVADTANLGGIKIGDGLSAANDGKTSVKVDTTQQDNMLSVSANGVYVKPNSFTKDESDAKYVAKNDVVTRPQDMEDNPNPVSAKTTFDYVTAAQSGIITVLNSKLGTISLRDGNNGTYTLYVDGNEQGTINIPASEILENAEYDQANKKIILTFNVHDEEAGSTSVNTVEIPLGDLVDTYTAKTDGGLDVSNNEFFIKVDGTRGSNALSVTETGAFVDSYKKNETYSKAEVDGNFVEKVNGKGLSTNDFTSELKSKLEGLSNTIVDNVLNANSENPVQNKVVKAAIDSKQDTLTSSSTVSLENNQPSIILNSTLNDNILTSNNGLYAYVDIEVNAAENKLILKRSGQNDVELALPGVKILDSSSYVNGNLRLVFADGSHVDIPVSDLVDRISVPQAQNGAVILHLDETQDGKQLIWAELDSSKLSIENANEGKINITRDGQSKKLYIGVDVERLASSEVTHNALKYDQNTNSLYVEDLDGRLSDVEDSITQLRSDINSLNTTVGNYIHMFEGITDRLTNIENMLNGGTNPETGEPIVGLNERLSNIEDVVNGGIDPETGETVPSIREGLNDVSSELEQLKENMLDFNDINGDYNVDDNDQNPFPNQNGF